MTWQPVGRTQLVCLLDEILVEEAADVAQDTSKMLRSCKGTVFNEDRYTMFIPGQIRIRISPPLERGSRDMRADRDMPPSLRTGLEIEEEGVLAKKALLNLLLMFKDIRKSRKPKRALL